MNRLVKEIIEEMRTELHRRVKSLDNGHYREILENLIVDHEAALQAIDDEEPPHE